MRRALSHWRMFVPLAHAAEKKLGVDFWRSCRRQACGGMLGAKARIAPAGGTARSIED
jgi:hypothetical protein